MDIDIRTLVLFLSLTFWLQFAALLLQQFVNKTYPGPGWWALGAAVLAVAFTFTFQRDNPVLGAPAIVANNALFAAGLAFFYVGVSRFFGRPVHVRWLVAFCTATTLVAVYYTYFVPDLAGRRVALSVNQSLLAFAIAARLFAGRTRTTTVSATFLAAIFAVHGLFYAVRSTSVFFVGAETQLFAASFTAVTTYTVTLIDSTLWTFGFILMVNQRLSEEAREDHANLDRIFDTMPDPVQITRLEDGKIARVNTAFTTVVGYPRAEVIGKTTAEIAFWSDPADRRRMIADLQQQGYCENLEAVFRRRDGSQSTAIMSARLITLSGAPYIISTTHDISARKRAEAELEQRVEERTAALSEALADLRRANAGKDAFLAAVSHELRTPVMGILSMSEALADAMAGAPDSREASQIELINQSGQRLLGALNSVIRYTHLMAGAVPIHAGICLLAEVCAAAARSIQDAASRAQQRVIVSVEPPDLEIVGDSGAVAEILQALLDNAVKFTPAGGQISLTVTPVPATGAAAGAVRLVVADTGIGMSDEQIAGLFQPLAQGDKTLGRRFSGLGLGLAYAHKLVELLGGALTVASTPGVGSAFTVTLPPQPPAI